MLDGSVVALVVLGGALVTFGILLGAILTLVVSEKQDISYKDRRHYDYIYRKDDK